MAQYSAKVDPEIPGRSVYAQYSFEASNATDASKKLKRLFRAEFGRPLQRGMFKVIKRASNPLPKGKFFKVTKAKINPNGSVTLVGPRSSLKKNPVAKRKNVAAGFYDEDGYFHPIRASHDYSPRRVGEKAKRKAKRKPAKAKRKATAKRKPTKRKR